MRVKNPTINQSALSTQFDTDHSDLLSPAGGMLFGVSGLLLFIIIILIFHNNLTIILVTLAEHTSDHGRQTNSSTEEKGEQV